jgi:hypothetical protein
MKLVSNCEVSSHAVRAILHILTFIFVSYLDWTYYLDCVKYFFAYLTVSKFQCTEIFMKIFINLEVCYFNNYVNDQTSYRMFKIVYVFYISFTTHLFLMVTFQYKLEYKLYVRGENALYMVKTNFDFYLYNFRQMLSCQAIMCLTKQNAWI